ncbi:hypothetical protein ACFSJ3_10930 [Corallincola platygyrae]|uniref:Uncharacterized protein n=1 Tax=Corallincola platygyrae TaxID=1193278 RepID=A0ABW4XNA3_9GAMM
MNKVSTGKCCYVQEVRYAACAWMHISGLVPPAELAKGSEQRLVGAPWVVRALGEQGLNKCAVNVD